MFHPPGIYLHSVPREPQCWIIGVHVIVCWRILEAAAFVAASVEKRKNKTPERSFKGFGCARHVQPPGGRAGVLRLPSAQQFRQRKQRFGCSR